MNWDKTAKANFDAILARIPVFLRDIAAKKVALKAETLAGKENQLEVTPKNVVDAFFLETPFGFHGPMKIDMKALGINYEQYGY
jgi:hypothetical protein